MRRALIVGLAVLGMAWGLLVLALSEWANPVSRVAVDVLGPPSVVAAEAYADAPADAPDFDHGAWDALLDAHVDDDGWVDYAGFRGDLGALDGYLEQLASADFAALSRDGKLALLLNAYNAFTVRLILEHPDVRSIRDIPAAARWEAVRWRLGGDTVSLDALEHEWIRPRFREPRVHFALVCAAVSCPKLRDEAYTAARLEDQLEDQAEATHAGARWFDYDVDAGVLSLTSIYHWYDGDFEQEAGSVLAFAARYDDALAGDLASGDAPMIRWIPYDWTLNDVAARP